MRRFLRWVGLWGPVLGYTALIWILSAQKSIPVDGLIWDKLLHLGAYTVMGLLVLRACHGGMWTERCWIATLAAVALTLVYGAIDEWHQSVVPGRDPNIRDWLADAGGMGLALVLDRISIRIRRQFRATASGGED